MLAIDDKITSSLLESHSTLEAITVSVSLHDKQLVICLLYIPPDADQDYHSTLLTYMSTLSCYEHLMIFGDVNWNNYQGQSDFSCQFCDVIFELNLEQWVEGPPIPRVTS